MTAPYWEDRRPPELEAVRRDDTLLDALAAREDASSAEAAFDDDPVVRLLGALLEDVNSEPIEEPADRCAREAAQGGDRKGQERRHGRRLPRSFVALSVTGVVLASTGVAAAAGGLSPFNSASDAREPAPHSHISISTTVGPPSATPKAMRSRKPDHTGVPSAEEGATVGAPQLDPKPPAPGRSPNGAQGGPGASPSNTPLSPNATPPTPSVTPTPAVTPDLAGGRSTAPKAKHLNTTGSSDLAGTTKRLGLTGP